MFSYTQNLNKNNVHIPKEFRAYFGWHKNLLLYLSTIASKKHQDKYSNEIIVSDINPMNRKDIWTLSASFRDRTGIIQDLSRLLKENKIDILEAKISTVEQNRYLNVKMELDCTLYKSLFDLDNSARIRKRFTYLDELKNLIILRFISETLFVPSRKRSKPLVKIKRNRPQFRSSDELLNHGSSRLEGGVIRIGDEFISNITKYYQHKFNSEFSNVRNPLVSITADYESRLVRLFIFFKNTGCLHCRIIAKNEIGAISLFSELFKTNKINVNQMFNRRIETGEYAMTDFLIQNNIDEKLNDSELKVKLEKLISIKSDYDMKIEFPEIRYYNE